MIVVGVGAVVAGSVPTVVDADAAGLTVVGGVVVVFVVIVVVGTSLAGTVKIDVEVVGASVVAGGSTGAAVVRLFGTRTMGVAFAAVGAGTESAVVRLIRLGPRTSRGWSFSSRALLLRNCVS